MVTVASRSGSRPAAGVGTRPIANVRSVRLGADSGVVPTSRYHRPILVEPVERWPAPNQNRYQQNGGDGQQKACPLLHMPQATDTNVHHPPFSAVGYVRCRVPIYGLSIHPSGPISSKAWSGVLKASVRSAPRRAPGAPTVQETCIPPHRCLPAVTS
jgi:hypothetical protein